MVSALEILGKYSIHNITKKDIEALYNIATEARTTISPMRIILAQNDETKITINKNTTKITLD